MSAFASDKASLGVGIVPDWLFWLIVWWAGWFAILLTWYERCKKDRMTPLVAFFTFIIVGFVPLFAALWVIKKAGQDK